MFTRLTFIWINIFNLLTVFAEIDIELCLKINNIEYKSDNIILINSDKNIIIGYNYNIILECDDNYKLINNINLNNYNISINNIINNISYFKHNCYNNLSCIYVYCIEKKSIYYILIDGKNTKTKEFSYYNKNIIQNCYNNIIIHKKNYKCNNYEFNPIIFIEYISDYNNKKIFKLLLYIILSISFIILGILIYIIYITKSYNIYEKIENKFKYIT
ncbi:unknown similar to AMEV160 [Mythimna separata entomopoxvirus 'L']|uniref:Uncharacterized protein n=1 Tax=Mythimna separata entomopoxvirus 'L' TaxID=1293572 RepID=A0A916NYL8_9POXV|nr:unknown similar to AMEV160 [Mythimna separata entomopoxvirus 'L']CCU56394.1 unknown similar to AMEV160 [Mythimna separata entomopoxvirus 'L']